MSKPRSSRSRIANDESGLCKFSYADGRLCRVLRQPDHPSPCIFHARGERRLLESDRLGSELAASLTGRFMTATDINFVLGKLFKAVAQNRVQPRQPRVCRQALAPISRPSQERIPLRVQIRSLESHATRGDQPFRPSRTHSPGQKPLPASAQALATQLLSTTPEPEVPQNS